MLLELVTNKKQEVSKNIFSDIIRYLRPGETLFLYA
jgi:S-adenosylmethionine:tRNA-ribosyltransferase-isomerase (queuine synthetase)